MESAKAIFNYLNDPQLVANFQNFFGVVPIKANQQDTSFEDYRYDEMDEISSLDELPRLQSRGNSIFEDQYSNYRYNLRSRKYAKASGLLDAKSAAFTPNSQKKDYEVKSKFFYYLFTISAGLGNEMFYCFFFPYWLWNVDGYVCRRLVMTWMFIMYIGQALKDIIRLPRPTAPAIRMERRYELEYGMPSTHSMIGLAFPFALFYFTTRRYEFDTNIAITVGVLWCLCVCTSRLYLGMHSVADVLAGLLLSAVLMAVIIPCLDYIDHFQLTSSFSPLVMIVATLAAALFYPSLEEWSTCRGDTTLILGVSVGVSLASWMNYQSNYIPHNASDLFGSPPYHIKYPDMEWVSQAVLRMMIGICSLFISRATMKKLTYNAACFIAGLDPKDHDNNKKLLCVELPCKYLTYMAISLNVVYLSPLIFRYFNIERPTAWTEV